MEPDTKDLKLNDLLAGINWGNAFLVKWNRLDSKKMRALGKLIQETILGSIEQLGKNLQTAHDNILTSVSAKSDLISLNTDRLIQKHEEAEKKIKRMEINISDISKDLFEAKTGPLKEIAQDLKKLKEYKENSLKRKRASMFPLPPDTPPGSLKPPGDSKKGKSFMDISIESQEQDYVFGRKSKTEPVDPVLTLRNVHTPLPGISSVLPQFSSLSFDEFERAESVDLKSDEETSKPLHPRYHLYHINTQLFHEQTNMEQIPYQDFAQLYSTIADAEQIEKQPDMFVDRRIPQKIYSQNSTSIWSIDEKNPQEIMLMLENMITAYKLNVLNGMTVLNAVNSIIYGFEGILKSWYVATVKAQPTILDEWSNTLMIGMDGKPSKLSDGSDESNYIGKMINAIREELCGEIKDTQQIQELFLYRQRLKRLEYFHPYYTLWLRRLFELDSCLDEKWKNTFVISLPKWFIPRIQKFVTASSDLTWGTLYNMVLGGILQLCDEKSSVKRALKEAKTPKNVDLLCRQYNLPYGHDKSPFHQGGKRRSHKHKRVKQKEKTKPEISYPPRKRRRFKRQDRRGTQRRRPPDQRYQKRYPEAKSRIKCYGCGGPHYKSQCPKKNKLKASLHAILVQNDCPEPDLLIEDFFHPKYDKPEVYFIQGMKEGYTTANEEFSEDENKQKIKNPVELAQYVSVSESNDYSYDSYDSYSESTDVCSQSCSCPRCVPAIKMMRGNYKPRGKDPELPSSSTEESKILFDLLNTGSEAGKDALRKKYLKMIEGETKKKETKIVPPELYNKVSLVRNIAQFQSEKPKIFKDFYEVSLAYQETKSKLEKLETEVAKAKEMQDFSLFGNNENVESDDDKLKVHELYVPNVHTAEIKSIVTQNNNIRVALFVGNKRHILTALVDSGASVNCIHASLIPLNLRQPSMLKSIAVIGDHERKVLSEAPFSLAVGKDESVRIQMLAIIEEKVQPMLILGNPFLQSTMPNGWRNMEDEHGNISNQFWFTYQESTFRYRIIGTPSINHQVMKIAQGLKERTVEFSLKAKAVDAQRMINSEKTQSSIETLKKKISSLYKPRPEEWKNNQHFVRLPYRKDYVAHPVRSKAIAMNAEQIQLCKKEINDLLQKGLIRESKSEWSCFGFYVNKRSEIVRGKPRLVINYQPLNEALAYDAYPIPKPTSILAKLKTAVVFSKFDMQS